MRPQAPCYNCDERISGCHSECDLYLTYRRALDKYNEQLRAEQERETLVNDFQVKQIQKNRKKRRR